METASPVAKWSNLASLRLRGTDLGGCWGSGTAGTGTGMTGEMVASEPAAAWCAET